MGALACFQEADKRRRAMSRPAVVALFLVCGLLAMNVMAEANDELFEEDVLVEEAAAPAKAATSTESSRARTWESRELDSGDATKQLSATASDQAAQQKKQALVKRHEINKVARKEMRKAATTSAKNSLNQAISGLTAHVKKMAARAAKLAAKSISKHTKFNHNNAAAERKMKMLEKDVVLLLAAKKKAIHEALISKQSYEKKAQRYKAAVLAKVKRAEGDIQTIQNKLAGFKVAKARERITEARMHKIAQNVVKQTVSLKSKQQRVARLNQQHITALKKEKKTAIKAKKSLKQLVGHYKQKLEVLKSTLKKLRKSPEIGKAMAARISKAKAKMVRHAKALRLQSTNISRLKRSLKHAEKNTKVLQIAASKRESVLRVANKAYVNLSGAVSRLKAMAITQKSVRLKAPKGSLTATATKTKSAIKTAIKDVAKTSKIAFRKAIIAAAEKAASSEANNQDTHQMTKESSKAVEVQPFDETDFASEDEATSLSQAQLDKAAQRLLHGAI